LKVTEQDKKVLRELGLVYAELAHRPVQDERKKLWYKQNALKPEKTMVLTFPEGGWNEIIPEGSLKTGSEDVRQWELSLRAAIHTQEHFKDDQVAEPVFNVAPVVSFSDYGVPIESTQGENRGSYRWNPPIKSSDDFEKLHFRTVTIDREESARRMDLANDNPDLLHKLMSFLRDSTLNEIDLLEREGVLSLNNEGDYVGSGGIGYTDELPVSDYAGSVRPRDMWVLGESQEFVGVSPQLFDEFALQYQMPIMKKFGLVCYGCCEPLDHKFDLIKKIPRLRRVSVSPWCDLHKAREALEDKYVFSWKPNPALLAGTAFDEDAVRSYIKNAVDIAKGCVLEIILKDTHTCKSDPLRFDRFTRIAQEVATDAV